MNNQYNPDFNESENICSLLKDEALAHVTAQVVSIVSQYLVGYVAVTCLFFFNPLLFPIVLLHSINYIKNVCSGI
jgi:fucose permease